MENFFTILGGMGTLASESFVRLLNQRTPSQADQDYLDYILVNHATIPDRTAFILGQGEGNPRDTLIADIKQQSILNPNFFVLTCNTAHHFYDDLQAATCTPILHMPANAAKVVEQRYVVKETDRKIRVGILATSGTVQGNIYGEQFAADKFEIFYPSLDLQQQVMDLIYRDVKEKQFLNQQLYMEILASMVTTYQCDVLVLGCTELSLMQETTQQNEYPVVDAQSELIDLTISLALEFRQKNTKK